MRFNVPLPGSPAPCADGFQRRLRRAPGREARGSRAGAEDAPRPGMHSGRRRPHGGDRSPHGVQRLRPGRRAAPPRPQLRVLHGVEPREELAEAGTGGQCAGQRGVAGERFSGVAPKIGGFDRGAMRHRAFRVVERDDGQVERIGSLSIRRDDSVQRRLQFPPAGRSLLPERPPPPDDAVGGGQLDPNGPQPAAVRFEKSDAGDVRQNQRNGAEADCDGAQDAGLAVAVAAVKNREIGVERQIEPLDGPVVLDLHALQLHQRFSTAPARGRERPGRRPVPAPAPPADLSAARPRC